MPLAGRYERRLTPADVGARVTVRRRLEEGGLGDVVGTLQAWSDDELTIQRRGGEIVTVAVAAIVSSRVIPPAPTRPATPPTVA